MGQWPLLLSLPGFINQPSSMLRSANLHSDEFADVTDDEWNRLMMIRPFYGPAIYLTQQWKKARVNSALYKASAL